LGAAPSRIHTHVLLFVAGHVVDLLGVVTSYLVDLFADIAAKARVVLFNNAGFWSVVLFNHLVHDIRIVAGQGVSEALLHVSSNTGVPVL